MDTPVKARSVTASALVLLALLLASATATAGPLGDLANSVQKAGVALRADSKQRPASIRLTALRPNLDFAQHPRMALDAPRENTVNLRDAQPRLPTAEAAVSGLHNPQGLHFEDASATVSPNLIRLARNYHHDGLPVVKLWQADRNMVSIGLNPHGVPGIFFTQALGK
jgi:hypothetical protein